MCGIAGVYNLQKEPIENLPVVAHDLHEIFKSTSERGKDSFGIYMRGKHNQVNLRHEGKYFLTITDILIALNEIKPFVVMANFRGEPSTEYVKNKQLTDIQPFNVDDYIVAHNGTISNDKEILKGTGILGENLIDSYAILQSAMNHPSDYFYRVIEELEGSYAMSLLYPNGKLILARNYRDLVVAKKNKELYWASKNYNLDVLKDFIFEKFDSIEPYSYLEVDKNYLLHETAIKQNKNKALVVISGGLDSTTSATQACIDNDEVLLLHFAYGCKAEDREITAVEDITRNLQDRFTDKKISHITYDIDLFENLGGSTLIDDHENIAEGDKGVETHNEWVHARNLVMISIAGAYCDRYDIGNIYLGLNMEEGSSYPDNTTEFYERLTQVLQVGTLSRPKIINPLANLMKHEIVALAKKIEAPIHLSWSCYHNGITHCGKCGPCIMRRVAFERNGITEGEIL